MTDTAQVEAEAKPKAEAKPTLPKGVKAASKPPTLKRQRGGRKSIWLPLLEALIPFKGETWYIVREMPTSTAAMRAVSHLRRAMKTRGTPATAKNPKLRIPEKGKFEFAYDTDKGKVFVYARCVK